MAIQKINLGSEPLGEGGDTYRSANTKINENFSNTAHAASRLVGTGAEQVPLCKDVPLASIAYPHRGNASSSYYDEVTKADIKYTGIVNYTGVSTFPNGLDRSFIVGATIITEEILLDSGRLKQRVIRGTSALKGTREIYRFKNGPETEWSNWQHHWTTENATKDPNGFLKSSSPIAEIYSDKMVLNDDAKKQGDITFEKLGVGDYLVKGSLGFAQEGWYIEMPKDANGNVLIAVVYEQLENNDLSIKTYAKKFDDETGDIVANVTKPRDIPDGRFISLRLHEILPEDELEDPIVDEAVEPEVVEDTTEEPSEEAK